MNCNALPVSLASIDEIVKAAHKRWTQALEKNGNRPPPAQLHAGWLLMRAMVDQLLGIKPGRYAYAVPCGGGKTQAVVALLVTLQQMRVLAAGRTVLVVAQAKKALCEIMRQLLSAGVPDGLIGIVHSQTQLNEDVPYASTGDAKRPIMLATHARLQRDGSLPDCCRKKDGSLHDLVIWDEALVTTKETARPCRDIRTALGHFADAGCPILSEVRRRVDEAVMQEEAHQKAGGSANRLGPLLSEAEAEEAMRALDMGWRTPVGKGLREPAAVGIQLIRNVFSLVDPRQGDSAHLMCFVVQVPDELHNIAILDASYAIDELRREDLTVVDGSSKAMTDFKRYDRVDALHYPVPSGRSSKSWADKVIPQVCTIVRNLPDSDGVLIFTYKDGHEKSLIAELQAAGIPVNRTLADGKPWLSVKTWGQHTTDNSFTHCRHVILAGLLRLPRVDTAAQLAARKRDLTYRLDGQGMRHLESSMMAGEAMQAMNRGAMRLTQEDGRAHAMTAHIIALDDLRPWLAEVMPGIRWQGVEVKEPTQADEAARRIVQFLRAYEKDFISKKDLYQALQLDLHKEAKAAALVKALIVTNWRIRRSRFQWVVPAGSRSLKRVPRPQH